MANNNELGAIRTFLTARLLALDSDFKPNDIPFVNDGAIGTDNFHKRFQMTYLPARLSTVNQQTTNDIFDVQFDLYFKLKQGDTDSLDRAMSLANEFRIDCARASKIKGQPFIKQVYATSMNPTQMSGNELAFKISLTFSFRTIFGMGANFSC